MHLLRLPFIFFVALLTLQIGCASTPVTKDAPTTTKSKTTKKVTPGVGKSAAVVIPAYPKRSTKIVAMQSTSPHGVLAIVAIPSLDAFAKSMSTFLTTNIPFAPKAVINKLAPRVIQQIGFAKSLDWMRRDQPAYLVVALDDRRQPTPILVLPAKDAAGAINAFAGEAAENLNGHHAVRTTRGVTRYLDWVGPYLVVTRETSLFKKHQTALLDVTRWQPTTELTIVLELKEWAQQFKKQMAMAKAVLGARNPGMAGAVGLFLRMVTQTERVSLHAAMDHKQNAAKLSANLTPLSNTTLARATTAIGGQSTTLGTVIPGNAMFWYLSAIDLAQFPSYSSMTRQSLDMMWRVLDFADEDRKSINAKMEHFLKQFGAQSAGAVYMDNSFPLAYHYVAEVKDGKATRKAFGDLVGQFVHVLTKAMNKAGKKQGKKAKKLSLKALAKRLSKKIPRKIMSLKYRSVKGSGYVADVFTAQLSKATLKKMDKKAQHILFPTNGKLQLAIAYGKSRSALAFGPTAQQKAIDTALGKSLAKSPQTTTTKGIAMLAGIELTEIVKTLSTLKLMPKNQKVPFPIKSIKGRVSMDFSSDSKTMSATVGIPGIVFRILGGMVLPGGHGK